MKKLFSALLSCLIIFSATGCGNRLEEKDKRPAIYISVFNGGYGRDWIDKIVSDYNTEKIENKYKISVYSNKYEFNDILSGMQSGTSIYDMFLSNSFLYKMIDANLLENISDIWNQKPVGSDRTIRQMLIGADDYAEAYGDGKGGLYALPIQESVRGFVYDHELFKKYGLLFNDEGEFIKSSDEKLSAGKDGIAETYDDGHPINEDQWDAMVRKCNQVLGYAFNYSGKFSNYLNDIYDMISAQYDGVDAYMLNYSYDGGEYNFGTEQVPDIKGINMDNGYLVAQMKGKKVALEFMDKYLACKDAELGIVNPYTFPTSSALGYSHTDAQTDFVVRTAKNQNKKIGMLVEGDWWENESKLVFNDLAEIGYKDYAFRKNEYRFMTLPLFEGQKETGSVYTIADNMYVGLKKQSDEEKKTICKEFISYMFQPKYIQNFSVVTGGIMPYDVELTEEQTAKLSPFSKNFMQLYNDPANKFINPQLYWNKYLTMRSGMPLTTENGDNYIVMNGLYYYDAQTYINNMITSRGANWQTYKTRYENYIALKV